MRFEPDGTPDQNRGKLQMCFGGFWGAICAYNGLRGRSAEVICDQLGFQRRGIYLTLSLSLFNHLTAYVVQIQQDLQPIQWDLIFTVI